MLWCLPLTWQVHPGSLPSGLSLPAPSPSPEGDFNKTVGRENSSARPGSAPTLQTSSWGSALRPEEQSLPAEPSPLQPCTCPPDLFPKLQTPPGGPS